MDDTWTVKRILDWISGFLAEHGDENPLLSAQWLVGDALGMSRIQLYADYDRPLTPEERTVLRGYTKRRAAGEPLQYITGTTDFRFITVHVEPGVLIPRPETEVLVSEALAEVRRMRAERAADAPNGRGPQEGDSAGGGRSEGDAARPLDAPGCDGNGYDAPDGAKVDGAHDEDAVSAVGASSADDGSSEEPAEEPWRVVDLCTGTGCIACSIACEVPGAQVFATDIEPKAVALARSNAEELGVPDRVKVLEGDLAEPVDASWNDTVDLLISNPPYIPTAVMKTLEPQVADFEPVLALDGGADGLDLYRRILPAAKRLLRSGGVLAVELHETCLGEASDLAREAGFEHVRIAQDLAGRNRVLIARAE